MSESVHSSARPVVRIGSMRSVVIGRDPHRIVATPQRVVVAGGPRPAVRIDARRRAVVVAGKQGIAGPPGEGIEVEIYRAGTALGGHRAVALDASGDLIYASAAGGIAAMGVIRDAVAAGEEVVVHRRGRVAGWAGLTPGAVYYLGDAGAIALTPPLSGALQPLGTATSATELIVDPDYPTFL